MELICRILEQSPLQQREYEQGGQKQTFTSIGFTLVSGGDTLYAEMTGKEALELSAADTAAGKPTLPRDYYYKVSLTARYNARQKDGQTYHSNNLYINKICML